jgi:hypothetical protein
MSDPEKADCYYNIRASQDLKEGSHPEMTMYCCNIPKKKVPEGPSIQEMQYYCH